MNNEEIINVLNVGVPIYRPVPLNTFELTESCYKNRNESLGAFFELRSKAKKNIAQVVEVTNRKSTMNLVSHLNFTTSYIDSTSTFTLDPARRVMNVYEELIERETVASDKLEEVKYLRKKLEFKPIITNEDKQELLSLYNKKYRQFLRKAAGMSGNAKYSEEARNYFDNQGEYFIGIEQNIHEIVTDEMLKGTKLDPYVDDLIDSLDVDKTALYMAKKYLDYMYFFLQSNDKLLATELSFFVDGYIKTCENKKLRIYVNNIPVDYQYIKDKYEFIKQSYKLNNIRLSRRLFEGKSFNEASDIIEKILKVKTINTNGELVSADMMPLNGGTVHGSRRENTPVTDAELKELAKRLEERYLVYLNNNPIAQIERNNEFENYIAFLYENGIVAEDRLNNLTRLYQMNEDRAFVMDIDHFDNLKGLTKSELRLHPDVTAMNHTDTFKKRMNEQINQVTPKSLHDSAEDYVLRLKK